MDFAQNKKNILLLGGLLCAGLGYYLFVLAPANSTTAGLEGEMLSDLQAKTEKFISHSALLQSLEIDTAIASDPALLNLISYQELVPDQSVGKSNIFDEVVTADGLE